MLYAAVPRRKMPSFMQPEGRGYTHFNGNNFKLNFVSIVMALCLIPALGFGNPEITVDLPSGSSMQFVRIEAGSFLMGTTEDHKQQMDKYLGHGEGREFPQHRVILTKGFYLGKYEVTREQWLAILGTEPERWKNFPPRWRGAQRPATAISWLQIQKFMAVLSEFAGRKFRLPTEAEWEYSARAGTKTLWVSGDDPTEAWEHMCKRTLRCDVGSDPLFANPWGLFDMQGNVYEFVFDGFFREYAPEEVVDPVGPSARLKGRAITRGGDSGNVGTDDQPEYVVIYHSRPAYRGLWEIDRVSGSWIGFRVLMELEEDPTSVEVRGWGAMKEKQLSK